VQLCIAIDCHIPSLELTQAPSAHRKCNATRPRSSSVRRLSFSTSSSASRARLSSSCRRRAPSRWRPFFPRHLRRVASSRVAAVADSVFRSDAVANSRSAASAQVVAYIPARGLRPQPCLAVSTPTLRHSLWHPAGGLSGVACVSRLGEGEGGRHFRDDTLCADRVVLTAGGPSSRTG
jgi:hypothetical protein